MQLRKASRKKAKIRLAVSGPSGSGKTYSALLIAFGIVGDWTKIALIDTEYNSADLYEHLGEFNVVELQPPHSTERYMKAISLCEDKGQEVIIIDSLSHEWMGIGGILESVDNVTAASSSRNAFSSGWKEMTPKHNEFMSAILNCKTHIIATLRSKQDYQLVEENGKKVPKKIGLNPIQRDGVEYEFTVHLDLSMNNHAVALKDRTSLFNGKLPFKPNHETGEAIKEWCENGVDPRKEIAEAIAKLSNCSTVDDLKLFKETLSLYVVNDEAFKKAGKDRMNEIIKSQNKENAAAN